jgi:hypothetical protein
VGNTVTNNGDHAAVTDDFGHEMHPLGVARVEEPKNVTIPIDGFEQQEQEVQTWLPKLDVRPQLPASGSNSNIHESDLLTQARISTPSAYPIGFSIPELDEIERNRTHLDVSVSRETSISFLAQDIVGAFPDPPGYFEQDGLFEGILSEPSPKLSSQASDKDDFPMPAYAWTDSVGGELYFQKSDRIYVESWNPTSWGRQRDYGSRETHWNDWALSVDSNGRHWNDYSVAQLRPDEDALQMNMYQAGSYDQIQQLPMPEVPGSIPSGKLKRHSCTHLGCSSAFVRKADMDRHVACVHDKHDKHKQVPCKLKRGIRGMRKEAPDPSWIRPKDLQRLILTSFHFALGNLLCTLWLLSSSILRRLYKVQLEEHSKTQCSSSWSYIEQPAQGPPP